MVDTCGLSYIWMNQNVNCSRNILLNNVAVNLQDQFRQHGNLTLKNLRNAYTIRSLRQNIVLKNI